MPEPINIRTRILNGAADAPRCLITGGVHGDEFESMHAIRRLARSLDPATLRGTLTLAPVVNESAYNRRHRTGEDELDLARICPGSPDGTVSMRTAHALTQLIAAADYYIDLHTGGTGLAVWPLAGYGLHEDPAILDTQRRMARAFNLPLVWGTCGKLDGRSLSVARDHNVPAIYTEYHGSAVCLPHGVDAYVDGCLNVLAELDMIDRPQPPSAIQWIIEDDRPNAGHMQLCHPAPVSGYFDPAVQLGQQVQKGDPLGTICDILGDTVQSLTADLTGIVITLHTYPKIDKGDGLVVIADTNYALIDGKARNVTH